MSDEIEYSAEIPGNTGNYEWPIRMDETDGYLGINQMKDNRVTDRVLLSRPQVEALIAFYRKLRPARKAVSRAR